MSSSYYVTGYIDATYFQVVADVATFAPTRLPVRYGPRQPAALDAMAVGATDDIPFKFALAVGETIISKVVVPSVYRGTDPTPAALLNGAAGVSGDLVVQRVSGGVAGTVYTLVCAVTTSTGRHLMLAAWLPVVDLAAAWS